MQDYLTEAENSIHAMLSPTGGMLPSSVRAFHLPELRGDGEASAVESPLAVEKTIAAEIASAADVGKPLDVRIELGRTRLPPDDVRRLRNGSVVSLDGRIDEPVEIRVGGRLVGRGDVLVVDGKIGVRVSELFCEELAR